LNTLIPNKLAFLLAGIFLCVASVRAVTFQITDPVEFNRVIDTNAVHTTNATVNSWLEGPVWIPSGGGYLLFCDQGNNRLKKIVPPNTVTDFLVPPANILYNGTILDSQERLVAVQAGSAGLRVVMVTNGIVTSLVNTCDGLKFYSPNDVVVKSDGTIWFTDPGYNGGVSQPPVPGGFQTGYHVYRFDPTNGNASCKIVITNNGNAIRPNGLCFSPDESRLYVADSGSARAIRVYTVSSNNTLSGGAIFATLDVGNGNPDGIRCDVDGRVWSSAGNGVHIFATDGHLIGKILFNRTANLCFGGPQYKTLYMTGQPQVTSIPVRVAGTPALKMLRLDFADGQLTLSWLAPSTGFVLEETELLPAANWVSTTNASIVSNLWNTVTLPQDDGAKFFRLRLN